MPRRPGQRLGRKSMFQGRRSRWWRNREEWLASLAFSAFGQWTGDARLQFSFRWQRQLRLVGSGRRDKWLALEGRDSTGGDGRGFLNAEFERFGRTEASGRDRVLFGGSTGSTCSVCSEEGRVKRKAGAAGLTSSAASTGPVPYQNASIVKFGQCRGWAAQSQCS